MRDLTLGSGKDYIYRGKMDFTGLNQGDRLELSKLQQDKFSGEYPSDVFPEILLIKVNNFDNIAKNTLDEWIYFLKNTELPINYSAKGLNQLKQKLNYNKMDVSTKQQYDDYLTNVRVSKSMLETAKLKGRLEGVYENNAKIVLKMYDLGQKVSLIAEVVEMDEDEVIEILKDYNRIK